MSPKATRRFFSGRVARANPPRRTGPIWSAPSTTKWSRAPAGASPRPIARPKPLSDEKARRCQWGGAWLAGGAGLTAVATIVGASARRSLVARADPREDPYADEDFERLDDDRS